jgi:hypothetical protein
MSRKMPGFSGFFDAQKQTGRGGKSVAARGISAF